jgi:hypothetical protein
MLHHIVLFTWNDKVPAGHPAIAANELRKYAATLDGLVSYNCGPNAGHTATAADFAVSAVFEDVAAWHAYSVPTLQLALLFNSRVEPVWKQYVLPTCLR